MNWYISKPFTELQKRIMNLPILTISGDISKGVDAIDREQHGFGGSMESTAKAKICQKMCNVLIKLCIFHK